MTVYLSQSYYVTVRNGCPIRISVQKDDLVEIACGEGWNERFEFGLEKEALRQFVGLAAAALKEMDATAPGR